MDILRLLETYNQTHLAHCLPELSPSAKKEYLRTLSTIDYALLSKLYKNAHLKDEEKARPDDVRPIKALDPSVTESAKYIAAGMALIAQNKCVAITMAGGQGTRLGFAGPKGCFDIGIGKSLFELQCTRLKQLSEKAETNIPWYIMTSDENHSETLSHFKTNNYFGYNTGHIMFFKQGMLPMLDKDGKIAMLSPCNLAMGPDGNGGVFAALLQSGALADMRKRGVEYAFFCGIDNALVKMCDPLFMGFAHENGFLCASKSILKRHPDEKVGVFCKRNDKPGIIEYSELSPDMRYAQSENGELVYADSNIVAHIIKTDKLKEICDLGLPYHAALKRASPAAKEGDGGSMADDSLLYKFETFIFDAFALFEDMGVLRVRREYEFAPVKNKSGEDSPETALTLLLASKELF